MLSGWASSGKDAAAALLTEELGFIRLAFADELKKSVAKAHGLPLSLFHTAAKDVPLCNQTPRDLLLNHALVERAIDPDVYSRRVADAIAVMIRHGATRIVISDWRYKTEHTFLQRAFTDIAIRRIRIRRSGIRPSTDVSEHDLDDEPMHAVIDNDGSISDLRYHLRNLLDRS